MFSEFHDFNRSLCLNARAAVRKQRQVLEKLKKVTFSQDEIYHATEFSEIVIFKCPSVLRIAFLRQKSMFKRTSGCPETMANARETEEISFSSK